MYQIDLIANEKITDIIPLLKILDPKIDDETLNGRLQEMVANHNYQCVGVSFEGNLIGISGLWILNKYYVGKHIEADNVIIHPDHRNNGVGEQLMEWIFDYGKKNGCIASELNCYVGNSAGLKFWLNRGYKILGFHCQKKF